MALLRRQKEDLIKEVSLLLDNSKLTVVAKYSGTSVKQLESLRKSAKDNGTKIKVIKNRLFIKALESNEKLKNVEKSSLSDQLIYAFNDQDEVAPAQSIATFRKENPQFEFVGAITADGHFMPADEVKTLAALPGKNQLIAEVMATLSSPMNEIVSGLTGGIGDILSGLEAKATK